MMNGSYVILKKGNDRKRFFLFTDGYARDMTKGFGELITNFKKVYYDLIKDGYKEI